MSIPIVTPSPSTLPPTSLSLKRPANMSPTSFRNEVMPVPEPDPSILLRDITKYLGSLTPVESGSPLALLLGTCAVQMRELMSRSSLSIDESIEKDKRDRSIVIMGLSESVAMKASERVEHDRTQVVSMLDLIGLEHSPAATFRMGTKSDSHSRPRLLKVMFHTRSAQSTFLAKSRSLSSHFPNVFIRPSLTKIEREEAFQLREQMRSMRKEGKDVVIYAGSIHERSQVDAVKKSLSSRPITRSTSSRTPNTRPFPHIPPLLSSTTLPSSTANTPPLYQPRF